MKPSIGRALFFLILLLCVLGPCLVASVPTDDGDSFSDFDGCRPFVQGPFELDAHAGAAGYTFEGLGLTFGAVTEDEGDCGERGSRCHLTAFADWVPTVPGWTAYISLGSTYPALTVQEIPLGTTNWDFDPKCGKGWTTTPPAITHSFLQAYLFDGVPGQAGTHLIAMEQITAGCGACNQDT